MPMPGFEVEDNLASRLRNFGGRGAAAGLSSGMHRRSLWEHLLSKAPAAPRVSEDPTTEEDLYRRYGRVPGSTVARVREEGQNATLPNRLRGMFAPHGTAGAKAVDEYERGVTDRITAQNRAKTTGKLQATGENQGRGGLAGLLRGAVEKSYNVVKAVGTQPRRTFKTLGWTPKLNTQRGYPGAKQDAALSQEIKERFGRPLSQGKR